MPCHVLPDLSSTAIVSFAESGCLKGGLPEQANFSAEHFEVTIVVVTFSMDVQHVTMQLLRLLLISVIVKRSG